MPYTTSYPPVGNPQLNTPSGTYGGNTMITGLAIPGNLSKVFTFFENISSSSLLFLSFGGPVSSTQYHVVIPPSGIYTDPGMIKVPIWVSGGSFLGWSM
jgi:hypothetical protein